VLYAILKLKSKIRDSEKDIVDFLDYEIPVIRLVETICEGAIV